MKVAIGHIYIYVPAAGRRVQKRYTMILPTRPATQTPMIPARGEKHSLGWGPLLRSARSRPSESTPETPRAARVRSTQRDSPLNEATPAQACPGRSRWSTETPPRISRVQSTALAVTARVFDIHRNLRRTPSVTKDVESMIAHTA